MAMKTATPRPPRARFRTRRPSRTPRRPRSRSPVAVAECRNRILFPNETRGPNRRPLVSFATIVGSEIKRGQLLGDVADAEVPAGDFDDQVVDVIVVGDRDVD